MTTKNVINLEYIHTPHFWKQKEWSENCPERRSNDDEAAYQQKIRVRAIHAQ